MRLRFPGLLAALLALASSCQRSSSYDSAQAAGTANASDQLAGTGNGKGFEGRTVQYLRLDAVHPCPQLDSSGTPVPNAEIRVTTATAAPPAAGNVQGAQLVRSACVYLDLPQAIPATYLSFAPDQSLSYQGASFVPTAVPVPAQGVNLLSHPEQLDDPYWGGIAYAVVPNVARSPAGTLTADLVHETTANDQHNIAAFYPGPANVAYTCSVFVQAAGRSQGRLQVYEDATDNDFWLSFDLTAATSSSGMDGVGTVASGALHPEGSGWYRVSVSGVVSPSASANSPVCSLYLWNGGANYLGDGVSGMYAWGFQLEQGTVLTPYFPGP